MSPFLTANVMPDRLPTKKTARLTAIQWVICTIASLGFAFDIYVLLMLPLIIRPALLDLGKLRPGTAEYSYWVGLLFWLPAMAGGVFGLIGGYLTDLFGRRRILTWSILLYAFSALASGYATTLPELLILRCLTFVGVSVEFVAAVTWLAELFPDPKQREAVIGYTQVAQSGGGILVAAVYGAAVTVAPHLPGTLSGYEPWRYTMMTGLIPVIVVLALLPFLPESPVWREKKRAGTLKRPSLAELFTPSFRRTTIVPTIMMACAFGAASGAVQQITR